MGASVSVAFPRHRAVEGFLAISPLQLSLLRARHIRKEEKKRGGEYDSNNDVERFEKSGCV